MNNYFGKLKYWPIIISFGLHFSQTFNSFGLHYLINILQIETAHHLYIAYRSFLTSANCSSEEIDPSVKKSILLEKEKRLRRTFEPSCYAELRKNFFGIALYKGDFSNIHFLMLSIVYSVLLMNNLFHS